MLRFLAVAVGLVSLLCWAPSALASPVAELLDAKGRIVAAAKAATFTYPSNGATLTIAHASITQERVQLDGVSLLGGLIQASSVIVSNQNRSAEVEGLVVGGQAISAGVNEIIPLDSSSYLITSQIAVAGGAVGVVGIRVAIGDSDYGLPAGTQILVGLPATPNTVGAHSVAALKSASDPLAIFAFTGSSGGAPGTLPGQSLLPFPFATTTIGEQAAALAERYLGIPYLWGGADPNTGFDCSGLAMYVYAQLGIHLTHYTGAQYNEGTPVPPTDLQPGDLVFFDPSSGGPQHEGIYLGSNQFIQAPHTGENVETSSLTEPAYALTYVGATRPTGGRAAP